MPTIRSIVLPATVLALLGSGGAKGNSQADHNVSAIVGPATASPAIDSFLTYRIHANSQIRATVTNWGYFGNFDDALVDSALGDSIDGFTPAPAFESPPHSGIEYLYDAGLWIGGIVNGDTLLSIGTRGSFVDGEGTHEFFPDTPAPLVFSDFDADEEYTTSYSDTLTDPLVTRVDPLDGFHRPLPVRVSQTTRLVQDTTYGDALLIQIAVANVGTLPIKGLWLGWMIDPDICHFPEFCDRHGCYCQADDIAGFHVQEISADAVGPADTVRAAWVADDDGNSDSITGAFNDDSPTGAFASMYLGGAPRMNEESFNWWIDRFSRTTDWGPQHIPGDTNSDGGHGRPLGDDMKYRLMSNREIDYDQVYAALDFSHVGWIKPPPDHIARVYAAGWDTRFLQTVGAVDLRPGDSVVTNWVWAVIPHWHTNPRHFHDTFDPHAPDTYRSGLNFAAMDTLLERMSRLWRHDYADAAIGPPRGWTVDSWTDSTATLKWIPRENRRLSGYQIERTDVTGRDSRSLFAGPRDSMIVDTGLDRATTYSYRIACGRELSSGVGPRSEWISVLPDRPKFPQSLAARRGNRQITLSWQSPLETSVSSHRIYRQEANGGWGLIGESNVGSYTDQDVVNDTVYYYRITAVSQLGNESDPAGPLRGIAFAFDGPPLIIDQTRSGPTALTDKDSVRTVWQRLLEPVGAEYRDANPQSSAHFGLDVYGPHPAVVVVTDGRGALESSLIPQLSLYAYAGGALVISGRDIFNVPRLADGTLNFKSGTFAYDVLGITAAYYPSVLLSDPTRMNAQFEAALSNDPELPNLDVDPTRTAWGLNPVLPEPGAVIPFVGYFDVDTARARVLYTFESNCGDKSPLDGRPVAVISKDPDHPAAAFSFPLSYIREDRARQAILAVLDRLGWSTPIAGDVNSDGRVDALDCLRLMNCLFRGAALRNLSHMDLNGDCEVNVVDLAILIDYTLHGGKLLESDCMGSGR